MSKIGKRSRLNRIFENDKTLIIPMERTRVLSKPWTEVAEGVIEGGANAIMTTPELLQEHYRSVLGRIPIILTVPLERANINLALKMDCAAIKMHYFGPLKDAPIQKIRNMAEGCEELGMPFLVELVPMTAPYSKKGIQIIDAEALSDACKIAESSGADFIKTNYTGDPRTFKKVVSSCKVPIIILGGERISDEECLKRIKGAIGAGAVGGAFGRNVTTHNNPRKIVKALRKIIHDNISVEESLKELQ